MAVPRTRSQDNVGNYHLFAEIAAGGMATVHLGHKQGDAQYAPVAIKRLHPQFTHDPEFLTMFADEVRVVTHIQHPNVVATLDIVQDRRDLSLVMQYVHGESFSKLLGAAYRSGNPASPAIVRTVMADVLSGLHAAHEARDVRGMPLQIVHRDVSPQNIIVGTDGISRILDFGIAKAIGRATVTRENEVRGKVAYMAPEQLQRGEVDRRTDVYAASIVLWEALTCKRLFHSDSDARTLARVMTLEVTPPSHHRSGVSPELDRAVLKGLRRDPSERFATAMDLASALVASGPCASRQEVGQWALANAAEKLQQRAAWISTMQTEAIRKAHPSFYAPSPSTGPASSHADVSGVRSTPQRTLLQAERVRSTSKEWLKKGALLAATLTASVGVGAWLSRTFPEEVAKLLGAAPPPSSPAPPLTSTTSYSLSPQSGASGSAPSPTAP